MHANLQQNFKNTNNSSQKMGNDFSQDENFIANEVFNALLFDLESSPNSDTYTPQMTAKHKNYHLNVWLDNYNGQMDYELYIHIGVFTKCFDLTKEQEALVMLQLDQELQKQQLIEQKQWQQEKDLQQTYNSLWKDFL